MRLVSRAMRMASALGALAGALGAQAPAREYQLNNGLRLLTVQRPAARLVEVSVGYFVGTSDDQLHGTAHLLEHLAMRETTGNEGLAARYSHLRIDGGALTTDRTTLFGMSGGAELAMLDTLLSLQRQRMRDLALSPLGLSTERRSVYTEVSGRPSRAPWLGHLFPGHRLEREGNHRDLDRITVAELRRFYATYYVPSNALLVITSPWADSVVISRATAAFANVSAGAPVPRPVDRDSSSLRARRWIGPTSPGEHGMAIAVPGLQHPSASLLDAVVATIATDPEARSFGVTVSLQGPIAPARVLLLSTRDTLDTQARLDAAWRRLLTIVESIQLAPKAPAPAHGFFDCEAAGDWRYCFADKEFADDVRRDLADLLVSSTTPAPATFWPGPRRAPPTVPTEPPQAVVTARDWTAPAPGPIVWRTASGGMEWVAREGGIGDTVSVLFVIAPATGTPTAEEVAALELLGRSWGALRDSAGNGVQQILAEQGVDAVVRPLPFPPLGTADAFRMLGDRPTAVGGYGLEFRITAPRTALGPALGILHRVLRSPRIDSVAFAAARARQLELLAVADTSARVVTEITLRRQLLNLQPGTGGRYAPADVDVQRAAIGRLKVTDVEAAARTLVSNGLGRLAALGADDVTVADWLRESGFATLGVLRWSPPAHSCGSSDTPITAVRIGGATPGARLFAFSCAAADIGPAARVANVLLGGSENALLARRLRTELGLAYSFRSLVIPAWGDRLGFWTLELDSPSASIDTVIEETRKILSRVQREGPPSDAVAQARTILADRLRDRSDDPTLWVANVFWTGGSPEEEASRIEQVTLEEVRTALMTWWRPEAIRWVYSAGRR